MNVKGMIGVWMLIMVFLCLPLIFTFTPMPLQNTNSLLFNGSTTQNVSDTVNFFAISAMASITYLTMIFAVATINYSFRSNQNEDAYYLKLLIKRDLIDAIVFAIVPQFVMMAILDVTDIVYNYWVVSMLGMFVIQVIVFIRVTNTVYYCILQHDENEALKEYLTLLKLDTEEIIEYPLRRYDTYVIKRTLYHLLIIKTDDKRLPKSELVKSWEESFNNNIQLIVSVITKRSMDKKQPLHTYFTYLSKRLMFKLLSLLVPSYVAFWVLNLKIESKRFENFQDAAVSICLRSLRPKLQASERVTEICLDQLCQIYSSDGEFKKIKEKDLIYCLLLLYCCKKYAEDRQDGRSFFDIILNRVNYSNKNDTYMYTLYGNILYHLGIANSKSPDIQREYWGEALEVYKCAELVNLKNQVARKNKDTLDQKLKRLSTKT